jgi:hypothetical protein
MGHRMTKDYIGPFITFRQWPSPEIAVETRIYTPEEVAAAGRSWPIWRSNGLMRLLRC